MDVIDQLQWRYATKKFDETLLLSKEKIATLKEAFNLTATSYGLQPVKLVILSNKELQCQLVPHTMNQQQVAQASHVLIFCIEEQIDQAYIASYFNRVQGIRQTPDRVLQPFKQFLINDFEKLKEIGQIPQVKMIELKLAQEVIKEGGNDRLLGQVIKYSTRKYKDSNLIVALVGFADDLRQTALSDLEDFLNEQNVKFSFLNAGSRSQVL
mgnify:CR=1 FL=1